MHTEPHIYNSEYETVTEKKCYLPKSTLKQALMFWGNFSFGWDKL